MMDIKDLKACVRIEDVAIRLGYKVDRRKGNGRHVEMVSPDGSDRIVINKGRQTYFHRHTGGGGDVANFVNENLNSFFVQGKTDWQKTMKILAQFANMPEPEYNEDREYIRKGASEKVFDPDRYEVRDIDGLPKLFRQRGITAETVRAFAPFIKLIRDKNNEKFDGFNIGFPYSKDGKVTGYEIRGGGGYKSKAAGTDSSSSAWIAEFGDKEKIGSVFFFFESALDAMAFYQHNKARLQGTDFALVSIGGTFSDRQILSIMDKYPGARAYDCFDNNLAGRIYGLRLACLLDNIPLRIEKTDNGLIVKVKDKEVRLSEEKTNLNELAKNTELRFSLGQWNPPKDFKDWNDVVMNVRINPPPITPSKYEREQNLAEKRSGLKM